MQKFLRKNWIHIVLWGGMFLYLAFAQGLYVHFFLKYGKPALVSSQLPAESAQITGHVDLFEQTVYDGQSLYLLTGWAYSTEDHGLRPEDYERQVILISDRKNYYFPLMTYRRPDVQQAFQSLGMELTNSGYHAQIAPDVIDTGIYRIGFVFHNLKSGKTTYAGVNKYLIRTPNQIRVVDPSDLP